MKLRRRYFLKRMLFFYLLVLIPILVSSAILFLVIRMSIKASVDEKTLAQLTVSRNSLETVLDVSGHVGTMFAENSDLYVAASSLLSSNEMDYGGLLTNKFMVQMMRYPTTVNQHVHSMYLYINNRFDRFLTSSGKLVSIGEYPDKEWLQSYRAHPVQREMWLENRTIPMDGNVGSVEVVTIYRPVTGGVVVTNIDRKIFNALLDEYHNYEGELLLVATDDQVLFSGGNRDTADIAIYQLATERDEITLDGIAYIANSQYSPRFGIRFWSLVPKDILYSGVNILLFYTGLALLASLLVTFVCAYISTHRSFSQLSRVIDVFGRAEQGLSVEPLGPSIQDEYSLLLDNIVRTFLNQSYLKLQLSERQYKQQAAELAALQLQINPHFLFNTLQTIDLEISRGSGINASKMLQHLSELLQYSLESPGGYVSISDEIKNLKKYCIIQKFRYENKFYAFWDIDPDLDKYSICRLILQPLVENSLYHGVKPKNGTAFVRISIQARNDQILVKVIDNGIGMEKESLHQLRAMISSDSEETTSRHIGLKNTNRRLQLSFGPESCLHIRSKKGMGTLVWFYIPLRPLT